MKSCMRRIIESTILAGLHLKRGTTGWMLLGAASLCSIEGTVLAGEKQFELINDRFTTIGSGDSNTFHFPRTVFVHALGFRVTSRSSSESPRIEVLSNGSQLSTFRSQRALEFREYSEERPLNRINLGGQALAKIELRNLCGLHSCAEVQVHDIVVYYTECSPSVCDCCSTNHHHCERHSTHTQACHVCEARSPDGEDCDLVEYGALGARNAVARIAMEINYLTEKLEDAFDHASWGEMMLPIKAAATELEIVANTSELASMTGETRTKAKELVDKIQKVREYLASQGVTINRDADKWIRRLLTLSNSLKAALVE